MSSKFYEPLKDFSSSNAARLIHEDKISRTLVDKSFDIARKLNDELDRAMAEIERGGDYSVYTGSCGIALYHYMLFRKFGSERNYDIAKTLVFNATKHLKKKRISFLTGDTGALALAAVFYDRDGLQTETKHTMEKLVRLGKHAPSDTPDEMLYGWAGFLYGLSFVNSHCDKIVVPENVVYRALRQIIDHGVSLACSRKVKDPPMMWEWHGKNYLGAAHGVAGILYMLLKHIQWLSAEEKDMLIKPTLDWLTRQRYDSGNFMSSVGSEEDRLVQWCHGAPGFTSLLILASERFWRKLVEFQVMGTFLMLCWQMMLSSIVFAGVYEEEKYMSLAVESANIVWSKGLLKKGYSLCHGVAGNAYSFLQLYQKTKESKYLYRASSFMEWCLTYPSHQRKEPDRPYSLYEGLAGVLYFLKDIEDPTTAAFPGFDFDPASPFKFSPSAQFKKI